MPRNRFARRVLVLSCGASASQLLIVAISPLLTRLFTPAEFGLFAVLAACISIAGPMAALRLEHAIMVARGETEARSLALLTSLVALAVAFLLAAVIALLEATPLALGRLSGLDGLLWLVPAGVLLYGLTQPFTYWSLRQGAFRQNGIWQLTRAICQVLSQLALGLLGLGAWGLGLGYVAGYVPGLIWRIGAAQNRFWSGLGRRDLAALSALAFRYRRYPVLAAPSLLLRLLAQFLPTILVAALYGPMVGGFFGLGQRV